MNFSLLSFFLGFVVCLSHAGPSYQDGEDAYVDNIMQEFKTAKRQIVNPSACMSWGLPCIPESQYRFARCCAGYVCACNIWKTACKCRSRLG